MEDRKWRDSFEAYVKAFGVQPPCFECVSDILQAEWWLRCVEEHDPKGPIEKGLESIMEELPEGAVL